MEIFGLQSLNVLLTQHLQTLAALGWVITVIFGVFTGFFLEIYLLFFTQYWWLALIYLLFIYYDKDTCGVRRSEFVRNWKWWQYFRDYFPLHLTTATKNLQLNPKRNYLFCSFPHGYLGFGNFSAFSTNASEFKQLFPYHQPATVTLSNGLLIPFYREIALSTGVIPSSFQSIYNVLIRPEGGNVVALVPGGAAEAYYARPGQYKLLLKKRKGFIRVALKTGAPLVPVVPFGENDVYEQLDGPKWRKFQELMRKYTGMTPVIPLRLCIIPKRRPITTVVGNPIDVEKIEEPTMEQIDDLHNKFTEAFVELFEQQKHLYLENAENIHLEF